MGSENSLILGLAAGYHYGDVRPFIASLKETGFRGTCVLFVSPTTRDVKRIVSHGVDVVSFERSGDVAHLPYNGLRYLLYEKYLRSASRQYDKVLITDVRDVIFQKDPFAFPWAEGVNVTLEDASMRIGTCPYMTRWTSNHLGHAAWTSIAQERISCSGTTVADYESMLAYLEAMRPLLMSFTPAKQMAGYDQGVHNHLLYSGAFNSVSIHDNSGPILTLGYTQGEPECVGNTSGTQTNLPVVLNDAQDPAYIVHQYDRKPELFKSVRKKYAPAKK